MSQIPPQRPRSRRATVPPLAPDLAMVPMQQRAEHPAFIERSLRLAPNHRAFSMANAEDDLDVEPRRRRQGAVPDHSRLLNGLIGVAEIPDVQRAPATRSPSPVVHAATASPELALTQGSVQDAGELLSNCGPSMELTPRHHPDHPEAPPPEHQTLYVTAVPSNDDFKKLLHELEDDHHLPYKWPQALVYIAFASVKNGTTTKACLVDEPDRALASSLINTLLSETRGFRETTAQWPATNISVATSRTPLPLDADEALDSKHGFHQIGTYHQILAKEAPEHEIPPALDSPVLDALLKEEAVAKGTVCYVLYFFCVSVFKYMRPTVLTDGFQHDQQPQSHLPLAVQHQLNRPAKTMQRGHLSTSVGHSAPTVVPGAVKTFLQGRFSSTFSAQEALQHSQFGSTYKNFHLTRAVFEVCDELNMSWPQRGYPAPYIEHDLCVTWENIVDWLPGAVKRESFRNWRGNWFTAQEVYALLTRKHRADETSLTSPQMHAWQDLHHLTQVEPCTEKIVPTDYVLLSQLTTDKFMKKLKRLRGELVPASLHEIIEVDGESDDNSDESWA
ncbi:hypothetical protein B0H16DRAFT_1742504 [Mycena metata]|uniref:Uncharacterized protein n=1 Tax=Mycena metata TaxID=1033252 RepID=A0AAD7H7X0_9AGAR|nr:hypothetical protein B0H16DRAFT_1742504 [Mycena metata]